MAVKRNAERTPQLLELRLHALAGGHAQQRHEPAEAEDVEKAGHARDARLPALAPRRARFVERDVRAGEESRLP